MKRKLLDASLIVLGATLLIKAVIAVFGISYSYNLPHGFRSELNAVMLLSGSFAIVLACSLFVKHVPLPKTLISRTGKVVVAIIGGWLLAAALFFSYGFFRELAHPSVVPTAAPSPSPSPTP